jgi:hypothetical protein
MADYLIDLHQCACTNQALQSSALFSWRRTWMVWWDYGPSGAWPGVTFDPTLMILVLTVLAALWLARSITSKSANHNKSTTRRLPEP